MTAALAGACTLREVRLYGPLRARFGRSHWLAVDTPAEAVRALCVVLKGFKAALLAHTGPGYRVTVGEGAAAEDRTAETLTLRATPTAVVRIVPVLRGAKRQGLGTVIFGAVLIAAGVYFQMPSLTQAGISMMLGGAIQMLSPQRRASGSKAAQETSQAINGPVNVVSAGGPVPLIIGRMLVGSVTVSAGLSTDELVAPAATPPAAPELPVEEPFDMRDYLNP